MPRVVVLAQDLLFLSRIREAAAGLEVVAARDTERLLAAARAGPAALLLLDLDADRLRPLEALAALREDPVLAEVPRVGYVSHVDGGRALEARRAGCSRVLARSAFVRELPSLLREHCPPRARG